MSFHRQAFTTRFATMGDPAEGAFDAVYPKNHRLGLNRPPFFMGGMTSMMRYTPDRMLRDRFVECMGVGKDRTLKLKVEKLHALHAWSFVGPVWLFVYDQTANTYYEAPLHEWKARLDIDGTPGTFENDGKPYIGLLVDNFPTAPQSIPEDMDDGT